MSNEMIQCWRMDDERQSMVIAVFHDQVAQVVYWGARLPDNEDLNQVALTAQIDVTNGTLDRNSELSMCPLTARAFPGQPGLIIRKANGERIEPDLKHSAVIENAGTVIFVSSDVNLGVTLRSVIKLDQTTHIFTLHSEIICQQPMFVDWLAAPVLPASQLSDEMIDFSGRWIGEFQTNRIAWQPGARLRENTTGRTGHDHFPGLIVLDRGTTNTKGNVQAFHYAWSGGHRMIAEELSDGRRQIQFGNTVGAFREPNKMFASAPLLATFSDAGLNGSATSFQRHLRTQILKPTPKPRPVQYHCWEAVHLNHDIEQLKSVAKQAADIGAERFVLDDGWFKGRKNNRQALGDWDVDPDKYPEGLEPFIDHIKQLGMEFGIWLEPEMVSVESVLYQAHPDWILGKEQQISSQQQYALDMSNSEVKTYLFGKISALLETYDIEYVKWDHNRPLPIVDIKQTLGTYELIDRLRQAHPTTEFQSCSSGGGRIDFGILERTQQVSLTQSNDAVERLRIQHDAALFLPACVTSSHMGPRQCHTSGREIDIRMRAWVSAQRHIGFEMDPNELSPRELGVVKTVIGWWKQNRDWMMTADIHRLDSGDPNVLAEIQIADDGSRFAVFAGSIATSPQSVPRPLRFTGLKPDSIYKFELVNRVDQHFLARGVMEIKKGVMSLSGQLLMERGITLPWSFPQTMWVIMGIETDATVTAAVTTADTDTVTAPKKEVPLASPASPSPSKQSNNRSQAETEQKTSQDAQTIQPPHPQTVQTTIPPSTARLSIQPGAIHMNAPQTAPPENEQVYRSAYTQESMTFDEIMAGSDVAKSLADTTHDSDPLAAARAADSEPQNIDTDIRDAKGTKDNKEDPISQTDLGASEPGAVSWGKHIW